MKDYVDAVCSKTVATGHAVASRVMIRYRDGAVVGPLSYEPDEFCGMWFVQFGLAVDGKFSFHRLDLGQARFRFQGESDVPYPNAIRKNDAEVKRDDLIEALDWRFGMDFVNSTARTQIEAMQICQRLWPCDRPPGGGAATPGDSTAQA